VKICNLIAALRLEEALKSSDESQLDWQQENNLTHPNAVYYRHVDICKNRIPFEDRNNYPNNT
jgi:hypothetical protein